MHAKCCYASFRNISCEGMVSVQKIDEELDRGSVRTWILLHLYSTMLWIPWEDSSAMEKTRLTVMETCGSLDFPFNRYFLLSTVLLVWYNTKQIEKKQFSWKYLIALSELRKSIIIAHRLVLPPPPFKHKLANFWLGKFLIKKQGSHFTCKTALQGFPTKQLQPLLFN